MSDRPFSNFDPPSNAASTRNLEGHPNESQEFMARSGAGDVGAGSSVSGSKKSKRPLIIGIVAATAIIIFLAVFLPIYFVVIRKSHPSSTSAGSSGSSEEGGPGTTVDGKPTSGGDGSTVTVENGTEFTYHNSFGGFCAGLNWLRIPLGFWAIETWDGEPYLAKTSWKYFLRVIEWARKYGLRVVLDLHAIPGSQNGLNHSGRLGAINFLMGNLGIANAERTLDYLRVLTEYISQPQYKDVIQVIALVNEPLAGDIGVEPLSSFYLRAYNILRGVTGFGEGNGPYIALQDGLQSLQLWNDVLPGADRVIMDGHAYFAFGGDNTASMVAPAENGEPGGTWPAQACTAWGGLYNNSRNAMGPTFCGEFSAAPNDCGLFIRAVGVESMHPQCAEYNDWENYNSTMKAGLQNWITASFDAFGDFFFWTWKIGPSKAGRVEAPLWSYKLGLDNGWIPKDPRTSLGKCTSLGIASTPWIGTFQPYRIGQAASPTVPADYAAQYPWPPVSIPSADVPVELLPTYTNTAPISTLPVPTFTGAPPSATQSFDGWFNDNDKVGGITTVAGCPYPTGNPAVFDVVPVAPCTGATSLGV
ncbi:glycoside hydrolase superfamily [Ephemerocybe angulata]|uniref:glucan 1,3-beta-glucosidase n=1 Tax=Ephemerocybe angulata TaxID=980116 RepID=A0A8H6M062_9AGAR|nr:glycoside hydrolase superfamily [Tulosesus angulatus]